MRAEVESWFDRLLEVKLDGGFSSPTELEITMLKAFIIAEEGPPEYGGFI